MKDSKLSYIQVSKSVRKEQTLDTEIKVGVAVWCQMLTFQMSSPNNVFLPFVKRLYNYVHMENRSLFPLCIS